LAIDDTKPLNGKKYLEQWKFDQKLKQEESEKSESLSMEQLPHDPAQDTGESRSGH
jgi:hypothetical protein